MKECGAGTVVSCDKCVFGLVTLTGLYRSTRNECPLVKLLSSQSMKHYRHIEGKRLDLFYSKD